MKKILSLFALLMTIVIGAKADADRVFALSDFTKDGSNYSWKAGTELLNKNKVTWVEVPSADANGTIAFYGSSNKSDRFLYIYKANGTAKDESRPIEMTASKSDAGTINYTSDDILTDGGKYYLVFSTANDFKAKNIDYTVAAATDKPTIVTQPVGATYQVNETPAALTVEATASAGELSYIWYSNTTGTADPNTDTPIDAGSATLSAANISTASVGTTYYYVVVGDDNGTVISQLAAITVVTEEAPEVSASASASVARTGATVTLTADVTAGVPAPTLQWYSCDDAEGTNAVAISGATNATYQPSTENIGTYYFLVKASNSVAADVASNVVSLKIVDGGTSGVVADLTAVSEGYVFIADNVTADGTLKPDANTIYDDGKLFVSTAFTVSKDNGSNTFAGGSHLNSMRLKNTPADYIAFKVAEPCMVTFYVENKGKGRDFKVGNAVADNTYGIIPDGQTSATLFIPEATTVYVTAPGGDRYMAGFEVKAAAIDVTLGANGYSTYCGDVNFTVTSGATAYTATLDGTTVTLNEVAANTVIGKGTGIVLVGTQGETAVLTPTTEDAASISGNDLVGVNAETASVDANAYVLSSNGTQTSFVKAGGYGNVTDLMNKAYVVYDGSLNSLDIQLDGEATAINNVDANDNADSAAPVKVIKNGKLFIGNYNVAGQQVK